MDYDKVFQLMNCIYLGGVNQHCFIWLRLITDLFLPTETASFVLTTKIVSEQQSTDKPVNGNHAE